MLELASHIVETKSAHFDAKKFEDHYENALTTLLKKKQAGQKIERSPHGEAPKVINLMDALRRSAKAEKGTTGSKRGRKRVAGQTEMLLPIQGKKGSEAVSKKTARSGARRRAG